MALQGTSTVVKGKIFREYIGSKSATEKYGGFPLEIINGDISEFHFILAFAKENYNTQTKKGKGKFHAKWNASNFSVDVVKKLKKEYKKVKVIISIGGRGSDSIAFDPEDRDKWIEKAKESLLEILLQDYKSDEPGYLTVIDGIDIAYERIESHDFAYCMGKVIREVKKKINGLVISIAPSTPVLDYYAKLFKDKTLDINWVNFQYYYDKFSNMDDIVSLHNNLIETFHVEKLLAGFSTDPNDKGNISLDVFFDACKNLYGTGSLSGIFVLDADDSVDFEPSPFYVEKRALNLLVTGSDDDF